MNEEEKRSVEFEEDGDVSIPTKRGINVSFNITEILKLLITEHFVGTLFALIVGALIYIGVVYNINFLAFITISETYKIPIILDFILIGLLSLCIKKLFKLNKDVENNVLYSKGIIEQFNKLKGDIDQFSKSLYSLYDIYNESNISLVTLNKIVSDNIYDVKKIMNVLNNINNGIRRIPDKRTLLDILTIRTKLLFGSAIEMVSEYLSNIVHNIASPINNQIQIQQIQQLQQLYGNQNLNLNNLLGTQNIDNNKYNQFIEEKVHHKAEEIKNQYITDIFILSKNTLDIKCKDNIQTLLNEKYEEIMQVIFKYNQTDNTVDVIIYNVDHLVKVLTVELMDIFTNNLHTTTVFDSEIINNDVEEEGE